MIFPTSPTAEGSVRAKGTHLTQETTEIRQLYFFLKEHKDLEIGKTITGTSSIQVMPPHEQHEYHVSLSCLFMSLD